MTLDLIENKEERTFFRFRVARTDHGKRLDQYLSQSLPHFSRSQAKKLIEAKEVHLNEKTVKPSALLRTGDCVSGCLPKPKPLSLFSESIPLSVLYEDASIIAIDKPAGMVVHPAVGNLSGTLVNALIHHCKDLAGVNGLVRPGIVHRLDKGTSGVMVVAKNDQAFRHLTNQFKQRTVEKVYLAIAYGRFSQEEGLIDADIGRHPKERKRMSSRTRKGRPAVTRWKVRERFHQSALLEVRPQTGRTHQIRVHLSSIGHPILGDPLYGRKGRPGAVDDRVLKKCIESLGRQALHAHRLKLIHPQTGERVEFVSPIPEDMDTLLLRLKSQGKVSGHL